MSVPDRARIVDLLGGLPGKVSFRAVHGLDGVAGPDGLLRLRFEGSHGAEVPGVYLPPAVPDAPAVLYLHAHGARYHIGTAELAQGRPALAGPWLGDLAAMGAAVLCLEMPCFGSRAVPGESALSKALLWRGQTLFGQMLAELLAGFDWLAAQPGIDARRIGCMGISMGGTQAWWLAALQPRLACAVSLCAFADLGRLIELGLHDHHGPYMTVPGLLAETTTGELAGLAAPMPLFIGVGLRDWSSPVEAFTPARKAVQRAYAASGAPGALVFHVEPEAGHEETPAMRRAARRFLERSLSVSA